MNTEWLTKRVTMDELRLDKNGGEFWRRLLDAYHEGDELWEFSTPLHFWQHLVGRGGVALVRQGVIIDHIVSIMN